jgi:hypothetical protein
MLSVQLGCERRINIEFYGADSHFCHSAYVTWSRVERWSAHVPARLSYFCCRTHFVRREVTWPTEIWEACWHVSRPELHARSRDVSRVTSVNLRHRIQCQIASHIQTARLTSHELTWREDSVSPALWHFRITWEGLPFTTRHWRIGHATALYIRCTRSLVCIIFSSISAF